MLWKHLRDKMQLYPAQVVCEDGAEMTYEQIIVFTEAFAKQLSGISCCAIMCDSEMAAGLALLSCFAAKVTALPLSKRYSQLHCNKIINQISPDAIITDSDGRLHITLVSDSTYKKPIVHPAIIMCTSGTTGAPKGAMLTEHNIIKNLSDITEYFAIGSQDNILIARPLYHCAVLTGEFLTALVKGAKIRFYSGTYNPAVLLKMLEQYSVTAFCGTPTLLSMMARFVRADAKYALRHICISGECMDSSTGKRIAAAFSGADIYHVYGLTEACPRVSWLPPALFSEYPDFVGIPLRSVELKILDSDARPTRTNQIGTLWVRGENVMAGYYNNPTRTEEILKDGWLCTGDCALINSKGLLKIMGRTDDMIIKAGMNIYPAEIEGALKTDPRVGQTRVFAQKDEKLGIQLVLDIVGDFSHADEVKGLCVQCLPPYQVPTKINLLPELPKNGSGKIIRR